MIIKVAYIRNCKEEFDYFPGESDLKKWIDEGYFNDRKIIKAESHDGVSYVPYNSKILDNLWIVNRT